MNDREILRSSYPELMKTDFRALLVFVVVLDTGSLSRAARLLGCSHSAISVSLKRVRDGSGRRLFLREGRELVPTAAAEMLGLEVRNGFSQLCSVMVQHDLHCERGK